jgi:tetratricopeptide (TPR) repeat protein
VFALAAIPARYALERHDWRAAAALEPRPSAFPWTEAMVYFARALGASRIGDTSSARAAIASLTAIHERLGASGESYWAEQVAIQQIGAGAWLALAQHRTDTALAQMREAGRREDATEKSAVTPGPLAPARELLGDMLMDTQRPREALAEYRATLRKEPNRFRALYGAMRAASLAGDRAAAKEYRSRLVKLCANADVPGRAELADIR